MTKASVRTLHADAVALRRELDAAVMNEVEHGIRELLLRHMAEEQAGVCLATPSLDPAVSSGRAQNGPLCHVFRVPPIQPHESQNGEAVARLEVGTLLWRYGAEATAKHVKLNSLLADERIVGIELGLHGREVALSFRALASEAGDECHEANVVQQLAAERSNWI